MYKWNAEDYSKSSSGQFKWGKELIDKLDLKGSESVLDIGCGDGKITAAIAGIVNKGSAIGIDSSKEMIDFAKQSYPADQYTNLYFRLLDATELDYTEEFDVVYSNAALHWVKDHVAVLNGIKRGLKPGGRALIQMGGKGNAGEELALLHELIKTEKWKKYFADIEFPWQFYSPDDYFPLVVKSGLKPDRIELIKKDMVHQGDDGIRGWIRSAWLPYTQRVPAGKRDEFIDDYLSLLSSNFPPDLNGNYHISMVRLEAELEK
jgi:trans-aconitate methyltransferase